MTEESSWTSPILWPRIQFISHLHSFWLCNPGQLPITAPLASVPTLTPTYYSLLSSQRDYFRCNSDCTTPLLITLQRASSHLVGIRPTLPT